MEDHIKEPDLSNNAPDDQFKEMLLKINNRYGSYINGNTMNQQSVDNKEINAFIDKLAEET